MCGRRSCQVRAAPAAAVGSCRTAPEAAWQLAFLLPKLKSCVCVPCVPCCAEEDRRASLARDRWRVLEAEQQQQQQGGAQQAAAAPVLAAADADGGGGGSQAGLLRLYPEAELVVEPEEGSDDDGAGRDEHVRELVKQYKQAAEQVGGRVVRAWAMLLPQNCMNTNPTGTGCALGLELSS